MNATFRVGDVVVYASHGIGTIESTLPTGSEPEAITVRFVNGLTVTLPMARAREALRPLSSENDLDDVRHSLRAVVDQSAEPWSRRNRRTREKLTSGTVTELAEVVRDGLQREQAAASRGSGTTAPSDRQLYLQARGLLVAEIALCRGIEPEAAEAWIVEQVGAE